MAQKLSAMWRRHKGVTLIELLLVILLIGIFSGFAIPNINDWITDRTVKMEATEMAAVINEKKSEVMSGKHGLAMIHWPPGQFDKLEAKIYYMTQENFVDQYSPNSTKRDANARKHCDYDPRNQPWILESTYIKTNIRHWPDTWICISKDGNIFVHSNFAKDPVTGKKVGAIILCSVKTTTDAGGSNRCNDSKKNEHRYMINWDRFVNLKIYKYNKKKDKWILKGG